VLPFYRGICPSAEHVCIREVGTIHAACLEKSSLAGPCNSLRTSAFLQVVVAFFSEVRKAMSRQNQFVAVCYSILAQSQDFG